MPEFFDSSGSLGSKQGDQPVSHWLENRGPVLGLSENIGELSGEFQPMNHQCKFFAAETTFGCEPIRDFPFPPVWPLDL